jgi:hypothetical protein
MLTKEGAEILNVRQRKEVSNQRDAWNSEFVGAGTNFVVEY